MKRDILITGGLGYLGGRIASYLSEFDNFEVSISSRRHKDLVPTWAKGFSIVNLDYENPTGLEKYNTIIHLASLNEVDSGSNPLEALKFNSLMGLKLLEAAIDSCVKRFIYFSTAHVYCSPLEGELCEDSSTKPRHPYAISHKTLEDFVLAAHENKRIEAVVLRLSNALGAPKNVEVNRWTLLCNDLCMQAVQRKKLTLKGGGSDQRDFIPMTDVEQAVRHFLLLEQSKIGDGLFNLGSGCSFSTLEIAEMIADACNTLLGYRPEIELGVTRFESKPLKFKVDKLIDSGFIPNGIIRKEIEETLKLCAGCS